MLPLIATFLLMAGLLSFGWLWPQAFDWGSDRALELALRGSWLGSIAVPGLLLSWFILRQPVYVALWTTWLAFGLLNLAELPVFRATELVGQFALFGLWVEVAVRAPGNGRRTIAAAAATIHLWMTLWGALAKVLDPGWMPDAPDVLMRVYGHWAAIIWAVPFGAIMALAWMLGRKR